jgi:hypothetical protein
VPSLFILLSQLTNRKQIEKHLITIKFKLIGVCYATEL